MDSVAAGDGGHGDDVERVAREIASRDVGHVKHFVRKAGVDWELIEREYRAGVLSVSQLIRACALGPDGKPLITNSAVKNMAKRKGWKRDLSDQVRHAANAKLAHEAVSGHVTEEDAIDHAANRQVRVIKEHERISSLHKVVGEKLLQQLISHIEDREDLVAAIEDEYAAPGRSKARQAALKAVSLPTHIASYESLTRSLKGLVHVQRQAVGLKDDAPEAPEDAFQTIIMMPTNGRDMPQEDD